MRSATRRFGWPPGGAGGAGSWDIKGLLVTLLLIGGGSFAFHAFATRWAAALDVMFIAIYLHFYLAVYLYRGMKWRWASAWLGVPLFFVVSRGLSMLWTQWLPGTEAVYLAAWTMLVVLCAHSAWKGFPSRRALAAAATCFAISLSLRQLDMPLRSD